MNELDESVPIWVGLCDEFGNEFPIQRTKLIRGDIMFSMRELESDIQVFYFRFFDAPENGRCTKLFPLTISQVLCPGDVAMFAHGDIVMREQDLL
jgi:hypothetical protein